MRQRVKLISIIALVSFAVLAGVVPSNGEVVNYSLGIGPGITPDYEGSEDYEFVPIPFAMVNWDNGRNLVLQGLELKANLLIHDTLRLGPLANFRPGRDDVDNSQVDKLKDVDDAFELGVFAGVRVNQWDASLQIQQDVSDGHDGLLFRLEAGYTWPLYETMALTIDVSTTYASDDYMESFFSIDLADNQSSGLATFDAGSGFKDIGLKFGLGYQMSGNWRMQAIGSYTRLLGDAEDSPVVDTVGDENQFFGGVLFVYTFERAKEMDVEVEPYHF